MNYWLREAPMADLTRQNAFSIALKRLLKPKIGVAVKRQGNLFDASIGGRLKIELSEPLSNELRRAFIGHDMKPIIEWVRLPWGLLRPSVQSAMRRVHERNALPPSNPAKPQLAA